MLWSLLKIIVFLGLAVALAFLTAWVLETPGGVTIAFGGREVALTPIGFVVSVVLLLIAAYILLKLVGFLVALVRFIFGDETALTRYFSRARERRGRDALMDGIIALAAGDAKAAEKQAAKAGKLLARTDAPQLIGAQAADMNGDRATATERYKALLGNQNTRYVAITGLRKIKLEEGDTDTALALAKKAFVLKPSNPELLRSLFELQTQKADWSGARETLNASMHARLLPRDVGSRRDAILSLADARAAMAEGNEARGNDAALQANKLAPTLVPAAALAAQVHTAKGAKRKATRTLTTAWAANPHPDLALAFAGIEPNETPDARRTRFHSLTASNPNHTESRQLTAELALAAEDFPAARKALGDLAETEPTTRTLALMAAIERGQGAPDAVVRGWLAKAINAPRGPQWTCTNCNHVHAAWVPVCENCNAFDTLDWRNPPAAEDAYVDRSAMLPLIIGDDPAAPEDDADAAPDDATKGDGGTRRSDVEDAELADGSAAPRAP